MANESPLIHDGAQCVLGFDARNSTFSGTTNAGPSGSGQYLAVRLSTTADRTVLLCSTAAGVANIGSMYGILQNKGSSGSVADVGIFGISKAVAGLAIVGGAQLAPSSTAPGSLIPFSSAADTYAIGVAIETASVGQVFTMRLYGGGRSLA